MIDGRASRTTTASCNEISEAPGAEGLKNIDVEKDSHSEKVNNLAKTSDLRRV